MFSKLLLNKFQFLKRMKVLEKISIFQFSISGLVILTMIVVAAYSLRSVYIRTARNHAYTIASIVRDHLTDSMINNTFKEQSFFINNLHNMEELDDIRIIRSPLVNKEYGYSGIYLAPSDEIEWEVLKTGKIKEVYNGDLHPIFRIVIPYIAHSHDTPNCLECHNVNEGDVLGAISISILLREVQLETVQAIVSIAIAVFIIMITFSILLRRIIIPLVSSSHELNRHVDEALKGNFTGRIAKTSQDEIGMIADGYNRLMQQLETKLGFIINEVSVMIGVTSIQLQKNLLDETVDNVHSLVEASKFKKSLEEDRNLNEIFQRISLILYNYFKFECFRIFEVSAVGKTMNVVIQKNIEMEDKEWCNKEICKTPDLCRAFRTGGRVDSTTNLGVCQEFYTIKEGLNIKECQHICMPIIIGGKTGLILQTIIHNFAPPSDSVLGLVELFMRESSPVIMANKLMDRQEAQNKILLQMNLELEKHLIRNKEEIQIAQKIQHELVPKQNLNIHGLETSFAYHLTSGIGGDIFDFIYLNDHCCGIFLADVSGHGVPAALIATMIKANFSSIMQKKSKTPSRLLEELNKSMQNLPEGNYFTALYGIFETKKNIFTYCRAGHPSPIYLTQGKEKGVRQLEAGGLPIGMFEDCFLEEETISLHKGDRFLFYTDGLTEEKGLNTTEFGTQKLLDTFYAFGATELQQLPTKIMKKVQKNQSNINWADDVTLICVDVTK